MMSSPWMTRVKRIVNNLLGRYPEAKRYSQLFDAIREIRPKTIMEIGTWSGTRAAQMIAAAQALRPGEEITYYGFDIFEDLTPELYAQEISKHPPTMSEVKEKLSQTGGRIFLYKGDTNATLPQVTGTLPPIDFAYIDGGHSNVTIANDWEYCRRALSPNGVLIFDDYWPDRTDAGCKTTVDAIPREEFTVEIMPIVDVFNNRDHGRLVIQFARVARRSS